MANKITAKKTAPKKAPEAPVETPETVTAEAEAPEEAATTDTGAGPDLPRGISPTEYAQASAIIVPGFAAKKDPDVIKTEMFQAGIPFSKLLRLYNAVTINNRLVIPRKEITDNIAAWFGANEVDFTKLTTWENVEPLIQHLEKEIEGATEALIMAHVKSAMAELDLEAPKKPRGGVRMNKFEQCLKAITNAFAEDSGLTYDGFKEVIAPYTNEGSAKKFLRLFPTFSRLCNGLEYGQKI